MQLKTSGTDLATTYGRVFGTADGAAADRAPMNSAERSAAFASLLRQSQATPPAAPTPVAPPAAPQKPAAAAPTPVKTPSAAASGAPTDDAATDATAAGETAADPSASATPTDAGRAAAVPPTPADTARALLRAKLRAFDGSANAKSAKAAKPDADKAEEPSASPKTKAASDTPAAALASANVALPTPLPPPPEPARGDARAVQADTDAAADPARATPRLADTLAARPDVATPAPDAATNVATADAPAATAADAGFAAMLAETRNDAAAAPSSRSTAVDGVGAATPAAGAFGAAPAGGTAAAQAVEVPTPVNSPDFAQHLGVQVSLLAKDGVQHAELHLNPADMGPVSVQITLDGTQARIDFGADVAATRHAIESGLPQLAGALADAGFTLAGGGVSQHAGGNAGGNGNSGSTPDGGRGGRTAGVDTDPAAPRAAARRSARIGGLDLYA